MTTPDNRAQSSAQQPSLGPRSRSGCKTCRRRHRKCDERKPTCTPCESRDLECDYQVVLKWASVGSINSFDAHRRRRSARSHGHGQRRREPATTSASPRRDRPVSPQPPSRIYPVSDGASVSEYEAASRDRVSVNGLPGLSPFQVPGAQAGSCHPLLCENSPPNPGTPVSIVQPLRWRRAAPARGDGAPGQSRGSRSSIDDDSMRHPGPLVDYDDEAIYSSYGAPVQCQDASSPPESSQSVVDSTFNSFIAQVLPDPAEEEAFTYYMKSVSTSCTAAYDGNKNPYRNLALLSLSHPVLLHGILSVSTGHMYNYGRSDDDVLSSRQSRALTSLQAALNAFQMTSDGSGNAAASDTDFLSRSAGIFSVLSPREVALAAIMMQTSSVLMTGIGSVEVHMKCALHFIRDLDYMTRPANSVFMRLLVQRFAMVDVVLAHLRFRRPLAPLEFFMYQSNEQLDHAEPAFRGMQGCPQRVLCFLARIAVLGADLVEGRSPPSKVQAEAYGLETTMRVWGHRYHEAMDCADDSGPSPVQPGSHVSRSASQLAYLDAVCECFYWTAHLLLMRRVFLDSTNATRVQLVRRHLFRLMDGLPMGCGPDSSLPFPFYMAAREAMTHEDRDWVRRKHVAWMDTYRDRSREYMMASVEKIWSKGASTASQPASNGVAPWDSPFEIFIREMDHQASYFMF